MNCLYCGTAFEAQRSTAKFCSSACRVAHKRHPVSVTHSVTLTLTAWFDGRRGSASLTRDYADLRAMLRQVDRAVLIQELIAYRADLDELRAARASEPLPDLDEPDDLPGDPYTLLRDYEVIKITTDPGTPDEAVLKIVAPKPQTTQRSIHHGTRTHIF